MRFVIAGVAAAREYERRNRDTGAHSDKVDLHFRKGASECALASLRLRISCGKPVSTFPGNALAALADQEEVHRQLRLTMEAGRRKWH
jgi:hypothetical protein